MTQKPVVTNTKDEKTKELSETDMLIIFWASFIGLLVLIYAAYLIRAQIEEKRLVKEEDEREKQRQKQHLARKERISMYEAKQMPKQEAAYDQEGNEANTDRGTDNMKVKISDASLESTYQMTGQKSFVNIYIIN